MLLFKHPLSTSKENIHDMKGNIINPVWESRKYYDCAKKGSLDTRHFGMKILKRHAKDAEKILDLGCCEGTRLKYLADSKKGVGVDISGKAINIAQKSYPNLEFIRANLEILPFEDNTFDLVYSAFVLEHLENPEKVILEAIRVTKKGGVLGFIAPNYGAPNRASPVFLGSRLNKFFWGFIYDCIPVLYRKNSLSWSKVKPQVETKKYFQDSDTQTEPYLRILIKFLSSKGLKIVEFSSCWEEELVKPKLHQNIFKFLGKSDIYPFKFWGPHLVVLANKI